MKNKIVSILMRRDGMSEIDAMRLVIDTCIEINEIITKGGSLDEAENILANNLMLEPDYLIYFL